MDINLEETYLLKDVIKTSDLIFITIPQNSTKRDLADAISSSTGTGNENSIHVGILKKDLNDQIQVIEASPSEGVISVSLKSFIENNLKCNPLIKFYVKRIKSSNEEDAKRWINEAEKHIGKNIILLIFLQRIHYIAVN